VDEESRQHSYRQVREVWCIREIEYSVLSSTARKCDQKVRFYKSCTSTASESDFDQVNRILCLKMGVLVFKVSRLSKCQGCLLVAYLFGGRVRLVAVTWNKTYNFLSLDTQYNERGQLQSAQNCSWVSLRFLTAPICSRDCFWSFLSSFDQNYTNTPITCITCITIQLSENLSCM